MAEAFVGANGNEVVITEPERVGSTAKFPIVQALQFLMPESNPASPNFGQLYLVTIQNGSLSSSLFNS